MDGDQAFAGAYCIWNGFGSWSGKFQSMFKRIVFFIGGFMLAGRGFAQDTASANGQDTACVPFAFGDFSWLNGTSRKTSPPLIDSK